MQEPVQPSTGGARRRRRARNVSEWLDLMPDTLPSARLLDLQTTGASVRGREPNELQSILEELALLRQTMAKELATVNRIMAALAVSDEDTQRRLREAEAPERMTISAAARYLQVSRNTIYRLIDDATLPAFRLADGGSRMSIRKIDVVNFLKSRTNSPRRRTVPHENVPNPQSSEPPTGD